MHQMLHTVWTNMFQLPVPWLEKILRSIIMYLVLIVFLRIFGKRELAQLNPFDLVVLLTLSNTVQNAIIGNDNSVTGGVVGAFTLLAANWLLMWALYRSPKVNAALEGKATVLIKDGRIDEKALAKETLTQEELISVLNKNGFSDPLDVAECVLEPNGTFFVKGKSPSSDDVQSSEMLHELKVLTAEVRAMHARLEQMGRGGAS
jgi:uncharacterized membrane protein YcaP (DUF421 family)